MAVHEDQVRYEAGDGIAVVTIDRPERRNAIDGATAELLEAAHDRFEADDEAHALVLTGAGSEAFCAGADMRAIDTFSTRLDAPGGPLGFTRRTTTKPTIAAIEGWCVAGGLELALWCDLRIVGAGARLGFTERRFGVPLIDGGTQRLPRTIGLGRALDLILTGRLVQAPEAAAIGLVTEVVEDGGALDRACALAGALAACPQPALLADRRAAIEGSSRSLPDGLALEARSGAATFAHASEGAARFVAGEGRHGEQLDT